jgi:alkyl hydroperoxide reductase subunit AhpC
MLQLGDTAPDFEAQTTEGPIHFHAWIENSWVVLFSHPKDFTPVCTTELGTVARLKPEFDLRGVRVIGLSVDSLPEHRAWVGDIAETQGYALNFPLIADSDRKRQGEDVIIVPSLGDEEAKKRFPDGWKTLKPYLRIVSQPKSR